MGPVPVRRMLLDPGPVRTLALVSLVNTVGRGLTLTGAVLYFTHILHLSGPKVGLGLTIAGGCGLLVGIPLGHLSDRRGAREVLIALMLALSVATLGYTVVGNFAGFLLVACVVVSLDAGAIAVRQGLIAHVLPADDRVRARGVLRAVTNVGIGLGSIAASLALIADTKVAYQLLFVADALTDVGAVLVLVRLPRVPPVPTTKDGPRLPVLRDTAFLVLMFLVGISALQFSVLEVGLPLWLTTHTDAPRVLVSVCFLLNTAMVIALQVRFTRGTEAVPAAARAMLKAAVALTVACALFAAADGAGAAVASAILLAGALAHVVGELQQSAAGWGLAYGLTRGDAHGQYQGVAATALALASMLGPVVMALVVHAGVAGWLALGVVFLVAGAAVIPVARWAS